MSALITVPLQIRSIIGVPIRWVNFWSYAHSITPKLVTPLSERDQSKKLCVLNLAKRLRWRPSWSPMLRLVDFQVVHMCPRKPDGHPIRKLIWKMQSLVGNGRNLVGLNQSIHSCCLSIWSVTPALMVSNSRGAWTYWVTWEAWATPAEPFVNLACLTIRVTRTIFAMPVIPTAMKFKNTVFLVINPRFRAVRRVFVPNRIALHPEPAAACHANQLG